MRRSLILTVMAASGLAAIAAGGTTAAQAQVPASSWQVSDVTSAGPLSSLFVVAAVSSHDAWAGGQGGAGGSGAVLMHWNGSSWADRTPASATPGQISAIGMSSADNVWAVAANVGNYALRWNGHSWTKFPFHTDMLPGGLAVISPDDVWVLGTGETGPFVRNFNGHKWRNVKSPVVPFAVSAISARDIWAVGGTMSYLSYPYSYASALANWNGKSWHPVAFPNLHLARHQDVQPIGIAALSRTNVWVTGEVFDFTQQIRSVLLHWNGKGWHVYRSPVNQLSGIASDGHGGVWMTADPVIPGRAVLVHYAYGRWAAQVPAPQPDGQPADDVTLSGIAAIPGTTSLWAVGSVAQPESTPNGMIETYGP
jgi:hypothetical protein